MKNMIKINLQRDMEATEPMGFEIRPEKSVGENFIEWAEQYWLLDKLIKVENPDTFAGEKCDYTYMRKIFIEKINGLIKEKLGL